MLRQRQPHLQQTAVVQGLTRAEPAAVQRTLETRQRQRLHSVTQLSAMRCDAAGLIRACQQHQQQQRPLLLLVTGPYESPALRVAAGLELCSFWVRAAPGHSSSEQAGGRSRHLACSSGRSHRTTCVQDAEPPDMDDDAMFAITPALGAALRSAADASSSGRAAVREALVTFKLRVLGLLDILARPSAAQGAPDV